MTERPVSGFAGSCPDPSTAAPEQSRLCTSHLHGSALSSCDVIVPRERSFCCAALSEVICASSQTSQTSREFHAFSHMQRDRFLSGPVVFS